MGKRRRRFSEEAFLLLLLWAVGAAVLGLAMGAAFALGIVEVAPAGPTGLPSPTPTAPTPTWTPSPTSTTPAPTWTPSPTPTAPAPTWTPSPTPTRPTPTPTNRPPTAIAGGPYEVTEGGSVGLFGSGRDPEGDLLTYAWDLDNNGTYEDSRQNPVFDASRRDGPSSQVVVLQVCDARVACSTSSATVDIANATPHIALVANSGPINEGSRVVIAVTASDPAGADDPLTYQFDCNSDGVFELGPQSGNSQVCVFADNGRFPVRVRVTDDDGGANIGSTAVVVDNVAPAVATRYAAQGTTLNLLVDFTDPGVNDAEWSWTIDWGDQMGVRDVTRMQGSGVVSLFHQYSSEGRYTIEVCVMDKDGAAGCDRKDVVFIF